MDTHCHLLEVYEPYEYQGPNPMSAAGIAPLRGPNGSEYYLIRLDDPVELEGAIISALLLMPRYNGDRIERAMTSACTVNICRARNGLELAPGVEFTFADIVHWGVGKIVPTRTDS